MSPDDARARPPHHATTNLNTCSRDLGPTIHYTDSRGWAAAIDAAEGTPRRVLYVWGANVHNWDRAAGMVIVGGGMADLTGPTHGTARHYYAGLVTTKAETDMTTALAALDRSAFAIIHLIRSGRYDRVEIPSGTAPGGHGLGTGLAVDQNGFDQPTFQAAITRALHAIHTVAAEVAQRRAVTVTTSTDTTRPGRPLPAASVFPSSSVVRAHEEWEINGRSEAAAGRALPPPHVASGRATGVTSARPLSFSEGASARDPSYMNEGSDSDPDLKPVRTYQRQRKPPAAASQMELDARLARTIQAKEDRAAMGKGSDECDAVMGDAAMATQLPGMEARSQDAIMNGITFVDSEDDDSDVRVLEQDGKPSADDWGDCVIVDPPPPSLHAPQLALATHRTMAAADPFGKPPPPSQPMAAADPFGKPPPPSQPRQQPEIALRSNSLLHLDGRANDDWASATTKRTAVGALGSGMGSRFVSARLETSDGCGPTGSLWLREQHQDRPPAGPCGPSDSGPSETAPAATQITGLNLKSDTNASRSRMKANAEAENNSQIAPATTWMPRTLELVRNDPLVDLKAFGKAGGAQGTVVQHKWQAERLTREYFARDGIGSWKMPPGTNKANTLVFACTASCGMIVSWSRKTPLKKDIAAGNAAATWRCVGLREHTETCMTERATGRSGRTSHQSMSPYTAEQFSRTLLAHILRNNAPLPRRRCREILEQCATVDITQDLVRRAREKALDSLVAMNSVLMAALEEEADLWRAKGHFVEIRSVDAEEMLHIRQDMYRTIHADMIRDRSVPQNSTFDPSIVTLGNIEHGMKYFTGMTFIPKWVQLYGKYLRLTSATDGGHTTCGDTPSGTITNTLAYDTAYNAILICFSYDIFPEGAKTYGPHNSAIKSFLPWFDVPGRTVVHDGEKAAASEIAKFFLHVLSFLDPWHLKNRISLKFPGSSGVHYYTEALYAPSQPECDAIVDEMLRVEPQVMRFERECGVGPAVCC